MKPKRNNINRKNILFTCTSELGSNGDFKEVRNKNAAIYLLYKLFTITSGTYMDDRFFGTRLPLMIFDDINDYTIDNIKLEIISKTNMYLNEIVSIKNINVTPTYKGFVVDISINIYNSNEKIKLDVTEYGSYISLMD